MANSLPLCYISYEGDYPEWSDIILASNIEGKDLEQYFKDLINAIEWSQDRKVKALKIEVNNEDTSHININKEITYKVEKQEDIIGMENKKVCNRKDIILKVVVKEIKKGKQVFNVYTALTEKGNWFDITFQKDIIKPDKNIVIKVKGENWFTTYKKDDNKKLVLNSKGEKIKKLVILNIDDILDFEEYPDVFKNYDLDTDI